LIICFKTTKLIFKLFDNGTLTVIYENGCGVIRKWLWSDKKMVAANNIKGVGRTLPKASAFFNHA
jgi:hypothetical protein